MIIPLIKKNDNSSFDFLRTRILGCRPVIAAEPSFSTRYLVKVVLGLYFSQN